MSCKWTFRSTSKRNSTASMTRITCRRSSRSPGSALARAIGSNIRRFRRCRATWRSTRSTRPRLSTARPGRRRPTSENGSPRSGRTRQTGSTASSTRLPDPAQGGTILVTHIFVVQLDIPAEHEAEFNRVYDTEHFPMLSKVPGVRSAARYRLEHSTVPGMQRYLTIYDLDSPDVLKSAAWEKAGAYGDWATKIRPLTTSRHHSVFARIA